MSWIVLIVSGLLEAVWATALERSDGFSRPGPVIVFGIALAASMGGLAFALREVPLGTGYAVWVGIGAATTVAFAMATGAEAVSGPRIILLMGLVGCIAGLKLLD